MQRGQALIFLLVGILVLTLAGGAFYLGRQTTSKPSTNSVVSSQISPSNPSSTIYSQVTPAPASTVVKLANAWNLGTKTYSNPKVDITFQYPSYFIVKEVDIEKGNADWLTRYENDPNVKQPLYSSTFYATFDTHKPEDPVSQEICDNKMTMSVQKYDNTKDLSLYNFIADIKKSYLGDGITETFDTYKKVLKSTNQPKEGSYVFEGIVGEKPTRTVYFLNKGKVYTFGLTGNCYSDGQYSPDANTVFEKMLKSIIYL